MLKLRVTVNGKVEKEIDFDREVIVGRKEPADIVIADGQMSSRHARLRPDGDGAVVCDLGSTNGTRIDTGDRLPPNVDTRLVRGQKLLMGPAVVELVAIAAESDSGFGKAEHTVVAGAGIMQNVLVQLARFKAAQPRLVVSAEHTHKVIEITEMEVVVGRDTANAQVAIPHQSVSARHARFKFDAGKFYVEDLGSANGTFVEGNRVMGLTPLDSQTAVTIGTVDCLFATRAAEAGGAQGGADAMSEVLCEHAVRMGKVTQQQSRDALAEHRTSGRTLGEIFVEKGYFSPKDWAEVYRQRNVLATLRTVPGAGGGGGGGGGGGSKTGLIVGIVVALVAIAGVAAYMLGLFGKK